MIHIERHYCGTLLVPDSSCDPSLIRKDTILENFRNHNYYNLTHTDNGLKLRYPCAIAVKILERIPDWNKYIKCFRLKKKDYSIKWLSIDKRFCVVRRPISNFDRMSPFCKEKLPPLSGTTFTSERYFGLKTETEEG